MLNSYDEQSLKNDVGVWVKKLMFEKTFTGLSVQKLIVEHIIKLTGCNYIWRLSTASEESLILMLLLMVNQYKLSLYHMSIRKLQRQLKIFKYQLLNTIWTRMMET